MHRKARQPHSRPVPRPRSLSCPLHAFRAVHARGSERRGGAQRGEARHTLAQLVDFGENYRLFLGEEQTEDKMTVSITNRARERGGGLQYTERRIGKTRTAECDAVATVGQNRSSLL